MFKVLDEKCTPTRGSKYSACVDLYAREDVVIGAGETVKVPLGVKIEVDELFAKLAFRVNHEYRFNQNLKNMFLETHCLQLEPRSSLRTKGLIAGTGIIDLDYKDEIMIILHNPMDINNLRIQNFQGGINKIVYEKDYKISKGDKIAQIMLCEHKSYLFGIETEEERTGGFGSTDKV